MPHFGDKNLPHGRQGYVGMRPKSDAPLPRSGYKEDLVAKGYHYVPASDQ